MNRAKETAPLILDRLPEDSAFEDIIYHIYVQEKIEQGLEEVRAGQVLSQEEVEPRMSKWLGK